MVVSSMTRGTDKSEANPLTARWFETAADVPLDYLVNALHRAVSRKQAAGH
jgi:hypothetical protein